MPRDPGFSCVFLAPAMARLPSFLSLCSLLLCLDLVSVSNAAFHPGKRHPELLRPAKDRSRQWAIRNPSLSAVEQPYSPIPDFLDLDLSKRQFADCPSGAPIDVRPAPSPHPLPRNPHQPQTIQTTNRL